MFRLLNKLTNKLGFCLVRKAWLEKALRGNRTMDDKLQLLSHLVSQTKTIFDLGAARGEWSQLASRAFPNAHIVLVEPLAEQQAGLNEFCDRHPSAEVVASAAGDEDGIAELDVSDDLDGSVLGVEHSSNGRKVSTIRLDTLVSERNLSGPFLIKFDTHGYEQKILHGAKGILVDTTCVIMECYNFNISPSAILFWQMCEHLDSLGFRVVDIADPWPRKRDGILWQMDIVWLRADHPVFNHSTYE